MRLVRLMVRCAAVPLLAALFVAGPLHAAKDDVPTPKERGVYVVTSSKLVRIVPNIVFDARIPYIESNNPVRFALKDVQYFVLYGVQDMQYLTLNNMVLIGQTIGKPSFMFGKGVDMDVRKKSEGLYSAKPKRLFGRGYYSLWINDSAWDFIIE